MKWLSLEHLINKITQKLTTSVGYWVIFIKIRIFINNFEIPSKSSKVEQFSFSSADLVLIISICVETVSSDAMGFMRDGEFLFSKVRRPSSSSDKGVDYTMFGKISYNNMYYWSFLLAPSFLDFPE